MKCDQAVTQLTTGSALGRWRARRHAARCPACAAEFVRLRRITGELAAAQPLSAAQRALWTSASTEPRPVASYPLWRRPALLAATAASVLLGIVVARLLPPSITVVNHPVVPAPGVMPQATLNEVRELDDLKSNLQALSRELVQLRRRAELLDERRDTEALSRLLGQAVALNAR
jgi:hypothetical protein